MAPEAKRSDARRSGSSSRLITEEEEALVTVFASLLSVTEIRFLRALLLRGSALPSQEDPELDRQAEPI